MPAPLDCPRLESWPALLDAAAPPDQRARYERHLESCSACQEGLDRPGDVNDPLRRLGRQVGDPTVAPGDPALAQVLERLYEVPSPVRTASLGAPDLYFLQAADRPGVLGTLRAYELRAEL